MNFIFLSFQLIASVSALYEVTRAPAARKKQQQPAWDYEPNVKGFLSPDEWYKGYPNCGGTRQSPINVIKANTEYDDSLKKIVIDYETSLENDIYDSGMYSVVWSMHTNGKTVNFELENGAIDTLFENEKFTFQQMHFHWNHSEHAIDTKYYGAELHLVHNSLITPSKFAVLSFLLQVTQDDNPALEPIIKKLLKKRKHEFKKIYVNFDLNAIIPFEVLNYYRYMGSLTMPNCMEDVNWYLTAEPLLNISQRQIAVFQTLRSDHYNDPLTFNARPIQELNDRIVRRSWNEKYRKPHSSKQQQQQQQMNKKQRQHKKINKSNSLHNSIFSNLFCILLFFIYFYK